MDEMQDKLGSILNNPQMMQQIMSLAQSLNQSAQKESPPQPPPPPPPAQSAPQSIDMTTLTRLGNLAKRANIDKDQQSLLRALSPYLCKNKLYKLERAMQAARMAQLASSFLSAGGLQFLSGR